MLFVQFVSFDKHTRNSIKNMTVFENEELDYSLIENTEWFEISKQVNKDPNDFAKWMKLIEVTEKLPYYSSLATTSPLYNTRLQRDKYRINKNSPLTFKSILCITFENFLTKYPYCEQIWCNYAIWLYELGLTDGSFEIFEKSLKVVPHSLIIWLEYIRFSSLTLTDREKELELFERARISVGYHYYAHLLYDQYIEFLEKNEMTKHYYYLLRRIIEIPLYHYSKYFKKWLNLIEKSTLKELKYIVNESDLSVLTSNNVKSFVDIVRSKERSREVLIQLKKRYLDIYITTQYNSYQFWNFEKSIKRPYYNTDKLSRRELTNWNNYIEFAENLCLKSSTKDSSITSNNENMAKMIYERCLITTCNYPTFWVKFSNFHLNRNDLSRAKSVLSKGASICGNLKLKIRLIDLYILSNDIHKAEKQLVEINELYSNSLEVFNKLLEVNSILEEDPQGKDEKILTLVEDKLSVVKNTVYEPQFDSLFQDLLNFSFIKRTRLLTFFQKYKNLKKNSYYFYKAYYDLVFFPTNDEDLTKLVSLKSIRDEIKENLSDFDYQRIVNVIDEFDRDEETDLVATQDVEMKDDAEN